MIPEGQSPSHIAVISICHDIMAETGERTLDLVGRVLRSDHCFAGMRHVVPDEIALSGTLGRWIDADRVDIVLVLDETVDSRPASPRAAPRRHPGLEAAACTEYYDVPAIGLVGVIDVRALRQQSLS